ncbi:response regulator transcription factor [Streptomyces sp. NPDC004610]|uniref:response regulator transcription factor n=1 Tax=unclassified Streptomyces TaxID=2593676 RepID=UPI0033B4E517
MARILIVEDDAATALALRRLLARDGHEVVAAADGREALRALFEERPELMVLETRLPELDGWQVLARTRDMSDLPVLVLSADPGPADPVRALRSGADDHVRKPYDDEELLARVEALLRRAGRRWEGERASRNLRLVPERRVVVWYGGEARLSDLEFGLLRLLVRHRGQVVTTERLLDQVWDDRSAVGRDRVKFAVLRLRRKLRRASGGTGGDPVEAVRGVGYRFTDPDDDGGGRADGGNGGNGGHEGNGREARPAG